MDSKSLTPVLLLSAHVLAWASADPAPGSAAAAATPASVRPPLEAFFSSSQIESPEVSPDGWHVAFLSPVADRMAVVVLDLKTGKVAPIARAFDADITQFFWKGNDRIVSTADPNGRESRAIMVTDLKTNSWRFLAENLRENRPDAAFASLVDTLPFDPIHILVNGRSSEGSSHIGLFRINLLTADRDAVFGSDPETGADTDDWQPDCEGSVRYRARFDGNRTILETRANDKSLWKPLTDFGGGFGAVYSPINFHGFSADGRTVWLSRSEPDGRDALFAYDARTNAWGAPIFQSDGEIGDVRLSYSHDRIESVEYGPDLRSEKWFDQRLEKVAATLRSTFPAKFDVSITSVCQNEDVFVVSVHSDVHPGAFYLLNMRGRTQLVELGKAYPGLNPDLLQPMQTITYHARDGLPIHGYLTLPPGAEGKRVPLIVLPHGGPYGPRDYWGFDAEVQFLASRGYAVLQPNYRGSGGFGEAFLLAGKHEWGRKMQDDLTDAVKWAIDQGIADPKRICIYGASYGGYAALAGAVFTPDLYCCAVNYVGISDLSLTSTWQNEGTEELRAFFREMVGDDKAFIQSYSPVNFVSKIKIPTLHAYGENDPRVDIKNWHRLERELKKYHKTYEYVHEDNEGHGFRAEKARINFYRHLEAFLDKYLAPHDTPAAAR